jgi:hypothetical protein
MKINLNFDANVDIVYQRDIISYIDDCITRKPYDRDLTDLKLKRLEQKYKESFIIINHEILEGLEEIKIYVRHIINTITEGDA